MCLFQKQPVLSVVIDIVATVVQVISISIMSTMLPVLKFSSYNQLHPFAFLIGNWLQQLKPVVITSFSEVTRCQPTMLPVTPQGPGWGNTDITQPLGMTASRNAADDHAARNVDQLAQDAAGAAAVGVLINGDVGRCWWFLKP